MQVSGETIYQHHGTHSEMVASQMPVENPFGNLPTTPTIFIDRTTWKVPSIQYGIGSMPVIDKPVQSRKISLLTPRHITRRSRNRMRPQRYNSKSDSPKVSFFNGCEEAVCNPYANTIFIPRENPRALFIQQSDQSPSIKNVRNEHCLSKIMEQCSTLEVDTITGQPTLENSFAQEPQSTTDTWPSADTDYEDLHNSPLPSKSIDKFTSTSFTRQDVSLEEHNPSISRHRNGEAAITYMHTTDIEARMPELCHSDYYMEPAIQELAVKESAEPDYCSRVKDFVVGRRGYGSVKFFGETDVRYLDLESIIQFKKCEILVYMDESKKPPVGQGLNKSAEISLLNVKCKDKKTGQEFLEGPQVENFEKSLKRKTEEQSADFISYNASRGEWKFQVKHFSKYCLDGLDSK